jgi:hypothetical protein
MFLSETPSPPEWHSPLREAMDTHPEFAEATSRYFLGKQLMFFN